MKTPCKLQQCGHSFLVARHAAGQACSRPYLTYLFPGREKLRSGQAQFRATDWPTWFDISGKGQMQCLSWRKAINSPIE